MIQRKTKRKTKRKRKKEKQKKKKMTKRVFTSENDFPFPDQLQKYTSEIQEEIKHFYASLDDRHQKAFVIAGNHLGTSFDIIRSIGFIAYQSKKKALV